MSSRFLCVTPGIERFSLDLLRNMKEMESMLWEWGVRVWKMLWFIILGWSKQWEILLLMIKISCLRWFDWYWRGLKLSKLVIKDWVHMFPRLLFQGVEWSGGLWSDVCRMCFNGWVYVGCVHESMVKSPYIASGKWNFSRIALGLYCRIYNVWGIHTEV